ncbi:DUF6702 family protein [Gilvibacter sp.]|uniref:DUF6702 family protein n=1 Tax=Gilvibacter sp. TaxID=2729997 RepID=UPI0034560799
MFRPLLVVIGFLFTTSLVAHPLRLSLCEIEYTQSKDLLTVNLKLFLTDVNEAITFDPYSKELAFCQSNEASNAEQLLMEYLNKFFYVKVNGKRVDLKIKSKRLSGEGDNTALWVYFEQSQSERIQDLEIKNAVFTDLFFDQNNIVYIHANGDSKSIMLNKKTKTHQIDF